MSRADAGHQRLVATAPTCAPPSAAGWARQTRPSRPSAIRAAARSGLPGWDGAQPARPLKRQRRRSSAVRYRSWLCASPDVDWRSRGARRPRRASDRLAIRVQTSDTRTGERLNRSLWVSRRPGALKLARDSRSERVARWRRSETSSASSMLIPISPTSSMRPSSRGRGARPEAGERSGRSRAPGLRAGGATARTRFR